MRRAKSLRIGVHIANAVVWEPVYRTHLRQIESNRIESTDHCPRPPRPPLPPPPLPPPPLPPLPPPPALGSIRLNIGAFFSMSGMTRNRILLPRMYACSSWFTRPSLPVCVMPSSWQFQLSSDSRSVPRYVSPFLSSICDGDATRATTGGAGWVDARVRREGGREDGA